MPSESCPGTDGFTLIEALVALAVVAVVLAAMASLVGTSARGTRKLEAHISLVETARAIVAGLPKRDDLAPGNFAGNLAGYPWRVDVLPFSVGGADPAAPVSWVPNAVVITVRSPSGAILRLDTVRLRRGSGA